MREKEITMSERNTTSERNYSGLGRVRSVGRDLALLWQGYRGEGHIPGGKKVLSIPQFK